jgi:ABC-type amino acid transport substrate-binding protein
VCTLRTEFINEEPPQIPLQCTNGPGEIIPLEDTDEAFQRILNDGVIRMGVNTVAGGEPYLYTILEDNSTSTNLTAGVLAGYCVEGAKEAVRRLQIKYNVTLDLEYVFVTGSTYFDPLVDALDSGTIDFVWDRTGVNDERAQAADFGCPTYYTEYVIAGGAGVSTVPPPSDGPTVQVGCIFLFCTFEVPPPFQIVNMNVGGTEYLEELTNKTFGVDYIINARDGLVDFINNNCPTCGILDLDPLATGVWAPLTAKSADDMTTESPTAIPTALPTTSGGNVVASLSTGTAALLGLLLLKSILN